MIQLFVDRVGETPEGMIICECSCVFFFILHLMKQLTVVGQILFRADRCAVPVDSVAGLEASEPNKNKSPAFRLIPSLKATGNSWGSRPQVLPELSEVAAPHHTALDNARK